MVIKPYGYGIWELMQADLDNRIKATGHSNAYFPLFLPKSFIAKEAAHIEGFAKECAVVTHYRLKVEDGQVVPDPDAKLEEELIVRPTSETIIWNTYRNWIQSYRDLPILINQWANVVRWEMRTRLFLRTAEFLWQEGHTAHATKEEAEDETRLMLEVYTAFAEEVLAIPVIKGIKTENERFAGAVDTYCIEAMMQDGKALQAGTSHYLGQNFAKAFDVKFADNKGQEQYVWATSWGVSTRLVGAVIMAHSDDKGLVLPPAIAPIQVVIVPIYRKDEEKEKVLSSAEGLKQELLQLGIRCKLDADEAKKPGWKFAEHEMKGVPIRIAIGPRDVENGTVELSLRDTGLKDTFSRADVAAEIPTLLKQVQEGLYLRALNMRENHTVETDDYTQFRQLVDEGNFVYAHWDGTTQTEIIIKEETKATIRCIPLDQQAEEGKCILTGKPSERRVLFAKAY